MYSPSLLQKLRKQGRIRVVESGSSQPNDDTSNVQSEATKRRASYTSLHPSPVKYPKYSLNNEETEQSSSQVPENEEQHLKETESPSKIENEGFEQKKQRLKAMIIEKEEQLRQLKLVKCYQNRHSIDDLEQLTQKWLKVGQQVVEEIWQTANEPKPTLGDFLTLIGVDKTQLRYNDDSESFE